MGIVGILVVAAVVLAPLAREYADFRRSWGLGRAGALGLVGLVVPALAVGLAAGAPLGERPWVQWGVTVAVALATYSLAVRAIDGARGGARVSGWVD